MATQARGILAAFQIVDESTYNVSPDTPSGTKIYLTKCSLERSQPLETSKVLSGNRLANKVYRQNIDVKGSIETELCAEWIGALLKHSLGSVTSTGSNAVSEVTVTAGGSGYTSVPTVSFSGGGGSSAAATAVLAVKEITVTDGGSGYGTAPTVKFSGGSPTTKATATATVSGGVVTAITVTNAGEGFTGVPTLSFTGGGGSGATATAVLKVNEVTVTAGGSGYTSTPTVAFSGGAGTGAAATAEVSPVQHKFELSQTNLPVGFRIESDSNLTGDYRYWRWGGLRVNSMEANFPQNGFPTLMWDLLGASATPASSSLDSTPTNLGHESFESWRAVIKDNGSLIGDTTYGSVKSCKLRLDNRLETDGYVVGSQTRTQAIEGELGITIDLEVLWDNSELMVKAENETESRLSITVKRGTGDGTEGNEMVQFNAGPLQYEPTSPKIEGPNGILCSYRATVFRTAESSVNNKGGLNIVVKNQIASY